MPRCFHVKTSVWLENNPLLASSQKNISDIYFLFMKHITNALSRENILPHILLICNRPYEYKINLHLNLTVKWTLVLSWLVTRDTSTCSSTRISNKVTEFSAAQCKTSSRFPNAPQEMHRTKRSTARTWGLVRNYRGLVRKSRQTLNTREPHRKKPPQDWSRMLVWTILFSGLFFQSQK